MKLFIVKTYILVYSQMQVKFFEYDLNGTKSVFLFNFNNKAIIAERIEDKELKEKID